MDKRFERKTATEIESIQRAIAEFKFEDDTEWGAAEDISVDEIHAIVRMSEGLFESIVNAYKYGYLRAKKQL